MWVVTGVVTHVSPGATFMLCYARSCDKCTEFWAWPAVTVHGAAAAVAQSAAMAVSGEAAAARRSARGQRRGSGVGDGAVRWGA